ncbi:MAG: hypothetical protein ABSA67_18965 [Candidatus Brocadiia bacterium]|jgi:hypothetical protein
MEKLVIPTGRDWNDVLKRLGRLDRKGDPRPRREHPWTFPAGQPIPITNNFSTLAPAGGFAWLNGSAGSDADHYGVIQPTSPGIAQTLVIVDSDIPPGGNGLGWTADGCEHPCYDPMGIFVVNRRFSASANSWAPMANPLGPVTATAAAVSGLAMGLFHGQRGDTKMVRTGPGATAGLPIKVLILSANHTVTQTAPNQVTLTYVS